MFKGWSAKRRTDRDASKTTNAEVSSSIPRNSGLPVEQYDSAKIAVDARQ